MKLVEHFSSPASTQLWTPEGDTRRVRGAKGSGHKHCSENDIDHARKDSATSIAWARASFCREFVHVFMDDSAAISIPYSRIYDISDSLVDVDRTAMVRFGEDNDASELVFVTAANERRAHGLHMYLNWSVEFRCVRTMTYQAWFAIFRSIYLYLRDCLLQAIGLTEKSYLAKEKESFYTPTTIATTSTRYSVRNRGSAQIHLLLTRAARCRTLPVSCCRNRNMVFVVLTVCAPFYMGKICTFGRNSYNAVDLEQENFGYSRLP